jgi:hypothetical protein
MFGFGRTKKGVAVKKGVTTTSRRPPLPGGPDQQLMVVFNCITAECKNIKGNRFVFGSGTDADFVIGGPALKGSKIALQTDLGRSKIVVASGEPDIFLNGARLGHGDMRDDCNEQTLQIGHNYFFLIKQGSKKETDDWKDAVAKAQWQLLQWGTEAAYEKYVAQPDNTNPEATPYEFGPASFSAVLNELNKRRATGGKILVHLLGSAVSFYGEQISGFNKPSVGVNTEGALRCPRCWQRFDAGDMLAVHSSKYGDPHLGEGESLRFLPSQIGADGRAMDDEGRPCSDWACPHCRGKLMQGFHQLPLHIFSLVGDSMAGKSYYLTVAIRELKRSLFRDFGLNFADADALENKALNDMITKLFTARDSKEAVLGKTQVAGNTFSVGIRHGTTKQLPQPFSYTVSNKAVNALGAFHLVLYDNAGEQFQADHDEQQKALATEHLGCSSAILYLFDPVQHVDMQRAIGKTSDPQIAKMQKIRSRCDQDVILNEIAGRVRQWKGLGAGEQSDVPLAIMIGKYDLWEKLLPRTELCLGVCSEGRLDNEHLRHNSRKVRQVMMDICPDIVAAAELISSQVLYFPVSSFGAPAVKVDDSQTDIGPDPSKLKPFMVDVPLLWLLSTVEPDILPTTRDTL